ncbi:site-specific integrase [Candidatus Nitrospira inopinata]|jgi:site-specific recombinase XerD|nr:hypothetical protein [Candidatus Nitrospira inopinata]
MAKIKMAAGHHWHAQAQATDYTFEHAFTTHPIEYDDILTAHELLGHTAVDTANRKRYSHEVEQRPLQDEKSG